MAAFPPGAGVPQPPDPTAAQNKTFTEYYNDASNDEFRGDYTTVMATFASPGVGNVQPVTIRDLISNDPHRSSMGYAVLVVSASNPNQPGLIYGMHTVSKYAPRFGFPATPWDSQLFATLHDVVGNQIPATIQFPSDAFARMGQGANYRVPSDQLIDAEFAADPSLEVLGPYANGTVDTELISCRNIVGIPHRYMRHFIPGPLTPRRTWEIVAADIITTGHTAACASLLNFLRLALTLNAAGDTASPLARGTFEVPLADGDLIRHRTVLVQHKLPGLHQTPTLAAGQAIAASVSELATEQRAYRQDMADRHAQSKKKTVDEYFGAHLHTVLRMCNVANVGELPPIYQAMADNGRKKHRSTMQQSMDEMLDRMGLSDFPCVISADLATKVSDFMWVNHPEDLGVGIHPFSVGEMNPDTVIALQESARNYDLITMGSVAPNLDDCRTLVGSGDKVSIPTSLVALDCQNHIFLAFLNVFLGQGHPVSIAWAEHTSTTKNRLVLLQSYKPRTPRHEFLLPALVQRWAQLRWSYWVRCQRSSYAHAPPPDWGDIWRCVHHRSDWESPLPERYLTSIVPGPQSTSRQVITAPSPPPTPPAAPTTTRTPAKDAKTTLERCVAFDKAYLPYKNSNKRVRDVIKAADERGHAVPRNSHGKDMCVSYHVKGVCNSNCGRKADHRAHDAAESKTLLAWCVEAFGIS
jgi:predicted RecA/RadA family phage recombinase